MPAASKLKNRDLSNEYVVGGRSASDRSVQRTDTRDRIETRLDRRAVDLLRLDPEIESDVSILADSIFSDGIEILPAILDENEPEFEFASEIADFCREAIADTARPFVTVLKEMFKAAFYNGVKVGEIVLRYRSDDRVNGKLVLDRINPKPISATAFVTDKFYNVIGLVGAKRAGQTTVSTGTVALSKDEIISREKFLIFALELEDNDPRGLSQLRSVFESYCDKQLTRAQWKDWRRTSAIPKKFGTPKENAKAIAVKNADGTPKITNGVPETISAQKALMNALVAYENNSAITAEAGTEVKQLEVAGTGVQFERHFKSCNSEIRKAVLGDSLVTSEADKDARAARESSKDVVDIRKQSLRTIVQNAVERDVFRLLTVVNYGVDKAHLAPKCFLGDTEANDWAGDLQAASRAGYSFSEEHFPQLDVQFGFEPRGKAADKTDGKTDSGKTDSGKTIDGGGAENTLSISKKKDFTSLKFKDDRLNKILEQFITQYFRKIGEHLNRGVRLALDNFRAFMRGYRFDDFANGDDFARRLVKEIENGFARSWTSKPAKEAIRDAARKIYEFYRLRDVSAFGSGTSPIRLRLGGADKAAIKFIEKLDNFYFSKFADNTSEPLRKFFVEQYFKDGAALFGRSTSAELAAFRAAAGEKLKNLTDRQTLTIVQTAVQRARNWAHIGSLAQAEIESARIVATLDARTTEICKALDGKIIRVSMAQGAIKRLTALAPEEFASELYESDTAKAISKEPVTTIRKFIEPDGKTISDRLVSSGIGMPPYHPNCRTRLEGVIEGI